MPVLYLYAFLTVHTMAKALMQVFHSNWNTGLSTSHGCQSRSFGKVLWGSIDKVFLFAADTMIQQKISVFRSVFPQARATKETVLYRPV